MDDSITGSILGALVGAVGTTGLFVALLKDTVQNLLARQANKELENQKHELGRITERLKFDLQSEMLKAQISAAQIHEVYPKLLEEIRMAEGALGPFIGAYGVPSWEGCGRPDFERVLSEQKVPSKTQEAILTTLDRDPLAGIKRLEEVLRDLERGRARLQINQAQNYRILKALYLSPEVQVLASTVTKLLSDAWFDAKNGEGVAARWEAVAGAHNALLRRVEALAP